jgi:hypothetical protein
MWRCGRGGACYDAGMRVYISGGRLIAEPASDAERLTLQLLYRALSNVTIEPDVPSPPQTAMETVFSSIFGRPAI